MKKIFILSLIALSGIVTAHAENKPADAINTIVTCHDTSRLPSGLSIQIVTGGFAGMTLANLSYRNNLGPFVSLGTVAVTASHDTRQLSAVQYVGKNFKLEINLDAQPVDGAIFAHVYADVGSRVFNQAMECQFLPSPAN